MSSSSSAAAQRDFMRGLYNFIDEVHETHDKEEEAKVVNKELAKIRAYYKEEKTPDWYQRRKYVSKLLYVHLLGYNLDFGHMPAIQLIGAQKFLEKQTGYLAAELILSENHELAPLLVNSIQDDLVHGSNQVRGLALGAIANIGGKEASETLAPIVLKLLLAKAAPPQLKKKAALAYLRLVRKNPDIVVVEPTLPEKLIALLNDKDLGVINTVVTLIVDLAKMDAAPYKPAVPRVISILAKITTKGYGKEYMYHNVAHPWLQVKCLQFLRLCPPEGSSDVKSLTDTLGRILSLAKQKFSSDNNKNANQAVILQAISVVFDMDNDTLLEKSVNILSSFIMSKDTNQRYLALESFAQLAEKEGPTHIASHQKTILAALKEVDISVRRRALDLLYKMCDKESAVSIIDSLLEYLVEANVAIREETVLKIAILAERFLTGTEHYVDVILRLVTIAGEYVSDEIWFRLIKVVVNFESIQPYAVRCCLAAVRVSPCHETMVKIAGYILGEYGHLIASEPGCSAKEQFAALHARFNNASNATKALLLSSYAKFANVFPESAEEMRAIFKKYADNIDAEVQQRACEYLKLTERDPRMQDLLQTVLDAIPPWEETREGGAVPAESPAAATASAGSESAPGSPTAGGAAKGSILDLLGDFSAETTSGTTTTTTFVNPALKGSAYMKDEAAPSSIIDILSAGSVSSAPAPAPAASASSSMDGMFGSQPQVLAPQNVASVDGATNTITKLSDDMNAKVRAQWMRLAAVSEGVLYCDDVMEIGVKSEYNGNTGRVVLFFGNRTTSPIVGLSLSISSVPQLTINTTALQSNVIGPKTQCQHPIVVKCNEEFKDIVLFHVGWSHPATGAKVSIDLPFPVVLSKFVSPPPPSAIAAPTFMNGWKACSGEGLEVQQMFKAHSPIDVARIRKFCVEAFHLGLVDGVDNKDSNLVAMGVLHLGSRDVALLMRLETNASAQMFRITLRSQSPATTSVLASIYMSQLTAL